MLLLSLGVVLWCLVHFLTTLGRGLRTRLIEGVGEVPYKIGFALSILLSLVLIVLGWRSTVPTAVNSPPLWGPPVTLLLMIFGVILFGAAKYPTAIKRYVRHPQLTAVAVWSVAHLLSNGEQRSLVLFGGLGLWALTEMFLISAREGAWVKPEAPGMAREIRGLAISVAVFFVLLFLHPYFAGVPVIPN